MEGLIEEARISRYSYYVESGVPWLGEIPEQWTLLKAKFLWKEKIQLCEDDEHQLLSVSQYTGVNKNESESRSESIVGYKRVDENDLVINIMLAWLGGLGVSNLCGAVSPAYAVYKLLKDAEPKYLHYLYRTSAYLDEFARRSKGVVPSRWRMYTEDFGQVLTLLPPKREQTAIARFLDRKTAQIDKAIAQKEKLIELLKERRQILIHNAVTKGLNPNVKMKDSGVEWIGEIPEHWHFCKLGIYLEILSGYSFSSTGFSTDSGIKLLRGVNISVGSIRWDDVVFWPKEKSKNLGLFLLAEGDVVFGMDRPLISEGMRVATIESKDLPCLLLQRVARIRPTKELLKDYLLLLLQSKPFTDYFNPILSGVSVPHISPNQIRSFKIGIPDEATQHQILIYVNEESGKISNTISAVENQIKKLKEYKSTLINSAVTGKIKVPDLETMD